MRYVLMTKDGSIMVFSVKACAELYRTIRGGVILDGVDEVLVDTVVA